MTHLDRRQFLLAGIATGAIGALTPLHQASAATPATTIRAGTRTLDIAGRAATVYGLTRPDGGHGLEARTGDAFDVRLENALTEPTLIHWHGLTPPWRQDGVPGITQPPIQPGDAYDYHFPLNRSGTHWMHSHLGLQEQNLLAAPLIIRNPADRLEDMQEVVMMLHDFSFAPPSQLMEALTAGGDGMAMGHSGHDMMGGSMMAMDINDIDHDANLANDRTLDDPEIVAVEPGSDIRLRIINGAASTNFTIDLGLLEGDLVAVDGNAVAPLRGRRFPIAMAQRLDIVLTIPAGRTACPILALREGAPERTGLILAPRGAAIGRLPLVGMEDGPVLGLALERQLSPVDPPPERPINRTITVDLSGGMGSYVWGLAIDGRGKEPIGVEEGERVAFHIRNMTMMSHPMHLHGHHFRVAAIGGRPLGGPMRDTVLAPAMETVTIVFDADNPGRWAFHCHNLYHMAAGMMTTVDYLGIG